MTLVKYLGIAMLAVSFPYAAQAQESGTYGAVGAATYDFDTYGVDVKLGHNFNKNFGIEAQGIIGLSSETGRVCSDPRCASFKQKTDYTIGAFAVGRLPLSGQFEAFARAGVHNSKYNFDINNALNTMIDETYTGVAIGGGLQYNLNSKNAIRLETTYLGKIDSQTSAISFVRKF